MREEEGKGGGVRGERSEINIDMEVTRLEEGNGSSIADEYRCFCADFDTFRDYVLPATMMPTGCRPVQYRTRWGRIRITWMLQLHRPEDLSIH